MNKNKIIYFCGKLSIWVWGINVYLILLFLFYRGKNILMKVNSKNKIIN